MSVRVYEEEEPVQSRWIMIFILLSLLAHALFFLFILVVNRHIPAFTPTIPAPAPPVSLTLVAPPPPQKRPFIPLDPQQNVPPQDAAIESNADTRLQSKTHDSRNPESLMPNLVSQRKHATALHESPDSKTKANPAPPTPPAPKQPPAKPAEPTPPQPTKDPQPQPKPDRTKPAPPKPTKTPPPPKAQPELDPATGLPVLPPLVAPTLAQTSPTPYQPASPPPMDPAQAMDMQGKAGISGAPSPQAMSTDLGRYKALVYQAVGSQWYPKVNNQFSLLGVGSVHIQYTIYKDGTVTTKVLDGGNSSMQMLLSISLNSITGAAPFRPFSDAMIQKVGDSYTDDFTFSVYGN